MVEIARFGRTTIPLMLRQQPLFWWRTPAEEMAWLPPIEVFDKKDKLVVRAEVPGMKPEEIDISVSDSTLTIKGKGKSGSEVKEEDCFSATSVPGIFAAGDVTNVSEKQVVIAADDGAKAALQANRYLQRLIM